MKPPVNGRLPRAEATNGKVEHLIVAGIGEITAGQRSPDSACRANPDD